MGERGWGECPSPGVQEKDKIIFFTVFSLFFEFLPAAIAVGNVFFEHLNYLVAQSHSINLGISSKSRATLPK